MQQSTVKRFLPVYAIDDKNLVCLPPKNPRKNQRGTNRRV
jgi:hypothetical protein